MAYIIIDMISSLTITIDSSSPLPEAGVQFGAGASFSTEYAYTIQHTWAIDCCIDRRLITMEKVGEYIHVVSDIRIIIIAQSLRRTRLTGKNYLQSATCEKNTWRLGWILNDMLPNSHVWLYLGLVEKYRSQCLFSCVYCDMIQGVLLRSGRY